MSRVSIVAVSATSVTGQFNSTMVTGFSVNDASIPFRPSYTSTQARVDFGTIVQAPPAPTGTGTTPTGSGTTSGNPTPTSGSSNRMSS